MRSCVQIVLEGQVQGIGFRPFVYRLARRHRLNGYVLNSRKGLVIDIEGEKNNIENFIAVLKNNPPSLSFITSFKIKKSAVKNYKTFQIRKSSEISTGFIFPAPDLATCPKCLHEIFSPENRRYLYPFTNCTQCGPRFSIVRKLPYDRRNTTMSSFKMCRLCGKEYGSVLSRRYHAQPNCCSDCGPEFLLISFPAGSVASGNEALQKTKQLLEAGEIVVVKGIGGFHICCDAMNDKTTARLRKWKRGSNKPFAIMVKDIATAKKIVRVSGEDRKILKSVESPILLLPQKKAGSLTEDIAPGNNYSGVMLPYTGLHHILLSGKVKIIIATSGNIKEEPIITDNETAVEKLKTLTPYFLVHDRDIYQRNDDSVINKTPYGYLMVRRSRGYVPSPYITSDGSSGLKNILAVGSDLKNVFALSDSRGIFLSQHTGDLENPEAFDFFKTTLNHFKKLFGIKPEVLACDLHPGYFSTSYAEKTAAETGLPLIKVQHHHAHLASCMADNNLFDQPVIGVTFDGTGYGTDGTIWGGEFLVGGYSGFKRAGSFDRFLLPSGEQSIYETWKTGISLLFHTFGRNIPDIPFTRKYMKKPETGVVMKMLERKLNSPVTSSCGRIFDGISAILGLREQSTFEGEAAIALQMIAEKAKGRSGYEFGIIEKDGMFLLDYKPVIEAVVNSIKTGRSLAETAFAFHCAVASGIRKTAGLIGKETGIKKICFGGGVFQNNLLLKLILKEFSGSGFELYFHKKYPTNDGGISLGQLLIANSFKSA